MVQSQVMAAESPVSLTVGEQHELYELETVIKHGLDTFQEVGEALATIRDKRLYRANYTAFADYTREKWGLGKSRAYQLIQGAEIAGQLSTAVDTLQPENERQLRPLDKLAPELRSAAWGQAVSSAAGNQPTAEQVQAVVDNMLGKTGRFDNDLRYPVIHARRIVYNRGYTGFNEIFKDPIFSGCDVEAGKNLNNQRSYDAYSLVEVPALNDPPIDEVIVLEKDAYYPVDQKQKIIYNEPISNWDMRSDHRYPKVEWVSEPSIRRMWQSVADRLCEYRIEPALPESLEWVSDARFKPGKMGHCYKCKGKDWAFEQWTPSGFAEVWICPEGHITRDAHLLIVTVPVFNQPVSPTNAGTPDTPEDAAALDSDVENILLDINVFADLLQTIIDTPEQIEDALTPENLKLAEKDFGRDFGITDKVLEAVKHLIVWFGNKTIIQPSQGGDAQPE